MNDIDRWFERTARGARTPVSLYTCLLTGRLGTYFTYRLRYPFLIATARFVIHVAEFFILLSSLGGVAAFTVMVLRAGSLIVAGGWWGLLEIMRERLRTFAHTGQRDAGGYEIGRWLVLSVLIGIAVTVAGAAAVLALSGADASPVARLYPFLIVLELAIDFPVRVLHSGIYATRRVYKPIWSIFIPTAVQLVTIGLGWYFYPAAAIVIAIVLSNAVGIWLTVHYCLEAYRLTGLRPSVPDANRLPRIPAWLGVETTLAGLSLRLDAVLVLALIGFYGTNTRTFDLTAGMTSWQNIDAFQFFYLILPLFRSTYDSAGIFYFDLVRLRSSPAIRRLQVLFFRRLLLTAPVIALYFWTLSAALGLFVLRDVPLSFLLALLPMFLLRSVIGIYQMRLFADGRFTTHVGTLLLLVVLLWLVWVNPNPAGDLIQITAAMTIQLIVLMNAQHIRDRRDPARPVQLQQAEWTRSLAGEAGPCIAGTITVAQSVTPKQKAAMMTVMRERISGSGYLAHRSTTQLVYYVRAQHAESGLSGLQFHLALQALTGGTARRGIVPSQVAQDGRTALSAVLPGAAAISTEEPATDALIEAFRTTFADGLVFRTVDLGGADQLRGLDADLLAKALPTILASQDDGSDLVVVGDRRLTPIFRRGELELIFMLPADADPASLKRWLQVLAGWNGHG